MQRLFHGVPTALFLVLALALTGCPGGGGEPDAGSDGDGGGGDPGPQACTSTGECPAHHLCIGGFCQLGTLCTGGTPDECPTGYTCNVMKEVCVPEATCTGEADCETKPATPHCLLPDGVCVRCTADSHCGDPTEVFCNAAFECEAIGPDCGSDADCTGDATKPHCDTGQGKCVACVTDTHCPGQQVCRPDTRSCVPCYLNSHCLNPTPYCDTVAYVCVECLQDTQCTGGERCSPVNHVCTDLICTSSNDCLNQPGPYCNTATGDCVVCLEHSHCGTYQWCRNFTCQAGCLTDEECQAKLGADYHCQTSDGSCFYAECMADGDCTADAAKPHCKTAAVPSTPAQYSCVGCTDDEHCDDYFECSPTAFTCRPMPCYRYPNGGDAKCQEIDECYRCDQGDGQCKPAETCPLGTECCQGYTCNGSRRCERNLDCDTDLDCPIDSHCNQTYKQCEFISCCDPPCTGGAICTSSCTCQSVCHQAGETCDFTNDNCCEGLRCPFMWPMCVAI